MKILNEDALRFTFNSLGSYLKHELDRPAWETYVEPFSEGGGTLYLFPTSWRLPRIDDYVAFSLTWSNASSGDAPCVQVYLPLEDRFHQRNRLLDRVRLPLEQAGFTDHYEGECEPDPSCPLWRNIPLQFAGVARIDLPIILAAILKGFRDLMAVEMLIQEVFDSFPAPPPACERQLKTIAFLDTEWRGNEPERRMTELAIINVAYDPVQDEVSGVLEEYIMGDGEKLDSPRARAVLTRAERIIAHSCSGDQSLLERELPGISKQKWICSCNEIDWNNLLGIQSATLENLLCKVGLRDGQEHHAYADARDLKRLLVQKHQGGRTYLWRLLANNNGI